jgi:hypothetical protein
MTWTNSLSSGLSLACMIIFNGCRQRYEQSIQSTLSYLVVDGFLNNGPDSTIMRLSRTTPLVGDYNVDRVGELSAHMTIEDEAGNIVYTFVPANNNGSYTVPGMNLGMNKKYRLRIKTIDNNEYLSDNIIVKPNPPIDSITWQRSDDGVTIYVNTHDPKDSTKYYRWDYTETWEYYTTYNSAFKFISGPNPGHFEGRDLDELVSHCWRTVNSPEILLASSVSLSQDLISQKKLKTIRVNAFELAYKYSILVKQYALQREAFEYYEALKKNTEQSGTIFDPQPFTLSGNIHNITNADKPALGYLAATNLQTQRIYIDNSEVYPWMDDLFCPPIYTVPKDSFDYFFNKVLYPGTANRTGIEGVYNQYGELIGMKSGLEICTDCTTRGGITKKPAFWP